MSGYLPGNGQQAVLAVSCPGIAGIGSIKAKANAVQGIPEIIRIAHGKYHRDNSGKKHKRKAANGWYRYDSYFVLPVYGQSGGIERYNVFHCSLIIRHANDGKMYLYDIIDIRKETSNSFRFHNLT